MVTENAKPQLNMLKRMWVNQPATSQPLHEYHGINVLFDVAQDVIYFLQGPVVAMDAAPNTLSEGWRE